MDTTASADRSAVFLIGASPPEIVESPLWEAMVSAGGRAVVVRAAPDEEYVFEQFGLGGKTPLERRLGALDAADYDALIVVGDGDTEDPLFREPEAIRLAVDFYLARTPIAALGRAPGLLVSAKLVDDRMLTSSPALAEQITEAGGVWHDCPVVVCHNGPNVLVTGRGPADMSEFCDAVVEEIAQHAEHSSDAGAR